MMPTSLARTRIDTVSYPFSEKSGAARSRMTCFVSVVPDLSGAGLSAAWCDKIKSLLNVRLVNVVRNKKSVNATLAKQIRSAAMLLSRKGNVENKIDEAEIREGEKQWALLNSLE